MTNTYPLGRNVEHDPQSWNYRHLAAPTPRVNVIHTLNAPCLNQGDLGSCEGNTAAEWLNSAQAISNRRAYWNANYPSTRNTTYLNERQAVDLYSRATELDDDGVATVYPPDDTGTSGLGIAKAMQAAGAVETYDWSFSFNNTLAALQTRPVMFGTNWYDGMFELDAKGCANLGPHDTDPVGGHAYLGLALDWTNERIGCQNHWGPSWGVNIDRKAGRFWIKFSLMNRLLSERGDVLIPRFL